MTRPEVLLKMTGITKIFPGVKALDSVKFDVARGEVHALMGENGAGKSTLMKVLFGIYHHDEGEILFKGQTIKNHTPIEALEIGISMIHQEISLATNVTIAENIWAGRLPKGKFGFIDRKKLYQSTQKILDDLHLEFNPAALVKNLSVAQMQMVEIARAVSYNSDLVIMDEPTSALTVKEIETLYRIIDTLKQRNISVIIITHKIDEVFRVADRITVMRDGCYIGTRKKEDMTSDELIGMMVGRELKDMYPKVASNIGDVVLEVEGFSKKGVFKDISFSIRRGEILGISGLMGAGRTEIMQCIFGIDRKDEGRLKIEGKSVEIRNTIDAIKNGLAMVTEDRKVYGLSLVRSARENIAVTKLNKLKEYEHLGFYSRKKEKPDILKMIEMLKIKLSSPEQIVNSLSGGNQQKVIIARWLLASPKVLILDEPTRGIDVGAKSEIYRIISELASEGMAVIMVSSELPEIIGMSDRVLVVHDGRLKGEVNREEMTQEKIMSMTVSKKERIKA